jgi:hypothetical protein
VPRVQSCRMPLNSLEVGTALYGLQGVLDAEPATELLNFLFSQISTSVDYSTLPTDDIVTLGRYLFIALPSLRDKLSHADYTKWAGEGYTIEAELRKRGGKRHPHISIKQQSISAVLLEKVVRKVLLKSNVSVSSDEWLFGMFQSQIVLRIPLPADTDTAAETNAVSARVGSAYDMTNDQDTVEGKEENSNYVILNIEINCPQHRQVVTSRLNNLRDKCLEARGVSVSRIDGSRVLEMTYKDVVLWLGNEINNALLEPIEE